MTIDALTAITVPDRINAVETFDSDVNSYLTALPNTQTELNTFGTQFKVDGDAFEAAVTPGITESQYQGEWDSATTYAQGDGVGFGGLIYASKAGGNLNNQPTGATDSSWFLIPSVSSISLLDDFGVGSGTYDADLEVYRAFKLELDNTGGEITVSGDVAGLRKEFSIRLVNALTHGITLPVTFLNIPSISSDDVILQMLETGSGYYAIAQVDLTL